MLQRLSCINLFACCCDYGMSIHQVWVIRVEVKLLIGFSFDKVHPISLALKLPHPSPFPLYFSSLGLQGKNGICSPFAISKYPKYGSCIDLCSQQCLFIVWGLNVSCTHAEANCVFKNPCLVIPTKIDDLSVCFIWRGFISFLWLACKSQILCAPFNLSLLKQLLSLVPLPTVICYSNSSSSKLWLTTDLLEHPKCCTIWYASPVCWKKGPCLPGVSSGILAHVVEAALTHVVGRKHERKIEVKNRNMLQAKGW